jgi:hypothetical protein
MIRLPQKKRPGDPILAEDWNTLLDAIAARTPRPGTGLELIASSGGFAYSQPPEPIIPRQSLPPFAVIGIEKSEGSYKVIIKEGWVIERKPKSEDNPAVKFHMPRSGETTLDTIPRPRIAMSVGDTLWCKYQTDIMGEISEEPEVIVAAEDQDGTHYYPEDPEGSGQEGTYYVKLFKLEDDEGFPKVRVYQQSDIEHWGQLWTGDNLGGGARVYKEHKETENIFKFRTIRGDYGVRENETDDEVELDFWAENIGEESGGEIWKEPEQNGVPIPDPPDGPAQFRKVVGRAYYLDDNPDAGVTEQIKIVTDEDLVRVIGNGKKGSRVWRDCDGNEVMRIEWDDGLITSTGDAEMEAGCEETDAPPPPY